MSNSNSHWEFMTSGQVKTSNSPEELAQNAADYFKWCDDHPVETHYTIKVGKEAGKHGIEKKVRAYSLKGLCLHCGMLEEYLIDIRQSKDKTSMWYIVVSRILYIIYTQNLEFAMVDVFNPVITSKILNMDKQEEPVDKPKIEIVDKYEVEALPESVLPEDKKEFMLIPTLSKTENEVLEKLELEKSLSEKSKE